MSQGPTDTSHWVDAGRQLLASAYPGDKDEEKHQTKVAALLAAGITHVISLQPEREAESFRPYAHLMPTITFHRFPIEDKCAAKSDLWVLIDYIDTILVDKSNRVLVHCWGGHGRTGLVMALWLAKHYGLNATDAIRRNDELHACRASQGRSRHATLTLVQKRQVIALCSALPRPRLSKQIEVQAAPVQEEEKPLFFSGHRGAPGSIGPHVLSQWWPAQFHGNVAAFLATLLANNSTGTQDRDTQCTEGNPAKGDVNETGRPLEKARTMPTHDLSFSCGEQWMMACKAFLFTDETALQQIMATSDPKTMKERGRRVKGFDTNKWNSLCLPIVTEGNWLKFSQNPALSQYLVGTGIRRLVEASPWDSVWGIGISAAEAAGLPPAQWPGKNLLGIALEATRTRLRRPLE